MSLVALNRRGFIGGLVGLIAAPAVVRVDSLMKISVPKIIAPKAQPAVGAIWFNTDNYALYIWDGANWIDSLMDGKPTSVMPAFDLAENMKPAEAENLGNWPLPTAFFGPAMPDVARAA